MMMTLYLTNVEVQFNEPEGTSELTILILLQWYNLMSLKGLQN